MANLGTILEAKIPLVCPKRVLERLRASLLRVPKKDLKLKGSWDRFLIDFGRVLGAAGGAKTRFSLESGTNFHILGNLKIRCLLDSKNLDFGMVLGAKMASETGHVGAKSRSRRGFFALFCGSVRINNPTCSPRALQEPRDPPKHPQIAGPVAENARMRTGYFKIF